VLSSVLAGISKACLSSVRVVSLAILAGALWVYAVHGGSWSSFVLVFLAPDLSLIGYAVRSRVGVVT